MDNCSPVTWKIDKATFLRWKKIFSDIAGKGAAAPMEGMEEKEWVDFLIAQRILPFYYSACSDLGNLGSDGALKKCLKENYIRFLASNEIYTSHARETLHAMNRAGIIPLVVKGVQLQRMVYPKPELRPTSDLDIVVNDKEEYCAALDVMKSLCYNRISYRRESYARNILKEIVFVPPPGGRIKVELHHSLRFGQWDKRRRTDEPFLRESSMTASEEGGIRFCGLADPANFLYLSYHAFQSHTNVKSVLWVNDLRLLRKSVDLSQRSNIWTLAEETGTDRHCRFGLELLDELEKEGGSLPSCVEDSCDLRQVADEKLFVEFRNVESVPKKMLWLIWFLFPEYQYLRQKYGRERNPIFIYSKHIAGIFRGFFRAGKLNG